MVGDPVIAQTSGCAGSGQHGGDNWTQTTLSELRRTDSKFRATLALHGGANMTSHCSASDDLRSSIRRRLGEQSCGDGATLTTHFIRGSAPLALSVATSADSVQPPHIQPRLQQSTMKAKPALPCTPHMHTHTHTLTKPDRLQIYPLQVFFKNYLKESTFFLKQWTGSSFNRGVSIISKR